MAEKQSKHYRRRYIPTKQESDILEYYAERYMIARRIGVRPRETRCIVKEAREALWEVSDRNWDIAGREPYEVRQWFDRWMKRRRREERMREEVGGKNHAENIDDVLEWKSAGYDRDGQDCSRSVVDGLFAGLPGRDRQDGFL
jgi:hypothetical protein